MTEGYTVNVADGGAMYAHEMSVNFTPSQFILDYKMITPRNDPRGKGKPVFLIQHNVVIVEPWHAKKMIEVLQETVKKYEQEYGKISKPKAVEKAEKKQKKATPAEVPKETPTYMG